MKNTFYFLLLVLTMAVVSCNTNDETSNHVENNNEDSASVSTALPSYSKNFNTLMKDTSGLFRGVDLGISAEEVKKLEDTAALEEAKDHIDYMVNYGELENADIRYVLKSKKVSAIEVYLYPKSKESQDSIFAEFETYFADKYGSFFMPDSNSRKWESKEMNVLILMEKKDTKKVHDIHISITSLTSNTASVQ